MLAVLTSGGVIAPAKLDIPNEDPVVPVDGSLLGSAQLDHKEMDAQIKSTTKGKRDLKNGQQILYFL